METKDHFKNGVKIIAQKYVITLVIVLFSFTVLAQDLRVAIFDPAGRADMGVKEVVRELISSVVVNTPGYTVLERELIDKVLAEHKFQESDMSEAKFIEAGKLMGANIALVSSVTGISSNYFISAKVIDVQTGRVEMQRSAQTKSGIDDLVDIVQKMVQEMLIGASGFVTTQDVPKGQRVTPEQLGIFFAGTNDLALAEHGDIRVEVFIEKEIIKHKTVTDRNGKPKQVIEKDYVNKTSIGSGTLKDGFAIIINNPTYRKYYGGRDPERYRLVFTAFQNPLFGKEGDARVSTDIVIDTHIISEYDLGVRSSTNNRGVTRYSFVLQ